MDNAGTPEKTPRVTVPSPDDIPVALRETPAAETKPRVNRTVIITGLVATGLIALISGGVFASRLQSPQESTGESQGSVTSPSSPTSPSASAPTEDRLLGHYSYTQAPQSELEPIVSDGTIKLRKAAAKAYHAMESAAQQEGVTLAPISGFRSIDDQKYLYFDMKAERGQGASERAKVSAPPGYSEHHTGYAMDLGDGSVPATNLSQSFEKTAAFRWLQANAARYSFELSFPKNNRQGVSYEPWHWRYVGDIESLKTFYKARSPQ